MTTGYADEIIFGNTLIYLKSLRKTKVAGTVKQKIGGKLVKHEIPAKPDRNWKLEGDGIIFETSTAATTSRRILDENADIEKHHYYDGMITGSFVIEKLEFNDDQNNPLHFQYRISLIEY